MRSSGSSGTGFERSQALMVPSRVRYGAGRGGFSLARPPLTTGRGGYFGGDPHPAPVRGESPLIPWMGPGFSPPVLTGTRLGNGRGRGQGQRTLEKHGPPRAVQRGGAGNWTTGPHFFQGFGGPVTNTNCVAFEASTCQ